MACAWPKDHILCRARGLVMKHRLPLGSRRLDEVARQSPHSFTITAICCKPVLWLQGAAQRGHGSIPIQGCHWFQPSHRSFSYLASIPGLLTRGQVKEGTEAHLARAWPRSPE